jgi:hypothetical protein
MRIHAANETLPALPWRPTAQPGTIGSSGFEDRAHAPIYEKVGEFNARTLVFLQHHSG